MNLTKKKKKKRKRKMGPSINKEKHDHMVVCGTHILILIFLGGSFFHFFSGGQHMDFSRRKVGFNFKNPDIWVPCSSF
jgi:hypothetical protein